MIAHDKDSNAILTECLANKTAAELTRAYTAIYTYLTSRRLQPRLQIMDNECPEKLHKIMCNKNIAYLLVPPNYHRNNPAEKAIGTWKEYFIAGLSSVDPKIPIHLWNQLVQQCITTLNLLRPSTINPRLSVEAQLNGAFDFNKTPIAPPPEQKYSSTIPHQTDAHWHLVQSTDGTSAMHQTTTDAIVAMFRQQEQSA